MFKFFAKKYVLKFVNDGIHAINTKINIKKYTDKVKKIIEYLNKFLSYLEDMEISSEEAEQLIKDTSLLFK